MRAVTLHEPALSGTEHLAAVVSDELAALGWDAIVLDVCHAHPADLHGCDLLIVGAPTHIFPTPRPRTPLSDHRWTSPTPDHVLNVREWFSLLDEAFPATASRPIVAVFSASPPTVSRKASTSGSTSRQAARVLAAQGFELAEDTVKFLGGRTSPTTPDPERHHVQAWVRSVVRHTTNRRPRPTTKATTP